MCEMGNNGWVQAGVASFIPAYLEGIIQLLPDGIHQSQPIY